MPRVRKYHEGGKGPGHPHSKAQEALEFLGPEWRRNLLPEVVVQSDEEHGPESNSDAALSKLYEDKDEIIQSLLDRGLTSKQAEQSFNWLTDEIGLRGRGYTRKGKSIPPEELPILDFTSPATLDSLALVGFSSAMGSELLGSANRGDEDRWEIFHDIKDKYTEKAKKLDTYDEAVPFGDLTGWDLSTYNREGESYPGVPGEDEFLFKDPIDFMPRGTPIPTNERPQTPTVDRGSKKITKDLFPAGKRPQAPILELLKPRVTTVDLDSKELQESNVSIYKVPKHPTQRMMKSWHGMRTGQIPNYDAVWDKERNQYVVRPIPQEEIDYYIEENKVVKKPYVAPVYRKYHRGGKALKGLMKKYGAGGSVGGWGAQGNFSTEYNSRQPEVVELPNPNAILTETIAQQPLEAPDVQAAGLEVAGMGGYDEVIMGSDLDSGINEIVDKIPIAKMFKGIGEFGSNLIVGDSTGDERKKKQKLAALLFSPHKLWSMHKCEKEGNCNAEADAAAEEERLAEEKVKKAEDAALKKKNAFWAADGMKIKNPSYKNGGLFEALRNKRAERRIAKTPVRDANSQEVLEMLASYGPDSPMMQGEYDPRAKEIVMYKDDPDTLKHEQVHAAQYGPLQRLAKKINDERSARIQDPIKRRAYRKLSENISPEVFEGFNRAGKLVLNKGEEFEAVLNTGVNAAKEQGVDFSKSYDDILSQLLNAPSPTNNMTGLMKFMDNKFTKKQRGLILKSIR